MLLFFLTLCGVYNNPIEIIKNSLTDFGTNRIY